VRYEYKYIIPNSKIDRLREMILPFVHLDENAKGRPCNHYTVRSIYFDTPDLHFYVEKIEGVPNRKKVRLRGYDSLESSNGVVFAEIKRKYQIPILKNRAKMTFHEALDLFRNQKMLSDVLEKEKSIENASRFFYYIGKMKLKPVVLVTYDREPYLSKTDKTIRITLDKNLRSLSFPRLEDLYENDKLKMAMPDHFILEVKFNQYYPSWMKAIVHSLNLKQVSASKYCICIDSHDFMNRSRKFKVISNAKLFRA